MADTFTKDPDEVLDFAKDWTPELTAMGDSDTIANSSWTVPAGLTKDSDTHTDTVATIWLSGGTLGEDYEVLNEVTTAGGRTFNKTLTFRIRAK